MSLTENLKKHQSDWRFNKKIDRLAYTPLWAVFADIITPQPKSNSHCQLMEIRPGA